MIWGLVALVIVIWPLFFIAIWASVLLLMSWIGGWRRLAARYASIQRPTGGAVFQLATGMVGWARYKRVLSIRTTDDGLFLDIRRVFRFGHPPLFIPWADIRKARRVTLFYTEFVAFDVGDPVVASLRLPTAVFDGTPVFID
jgi:hypothetical protein